MVAQLKEEQNEEYVYSNEWQMITQLKSWVAINPSVGCVWNCAYCIQHKDKFYDTRDYKKVSILKNHNQQEYTSQLILEEIKSSPLITTISPLTFYNYSDPFLPKNRKQLVEILSALDTDGFTNPVGLITKTYADDDTINALSKLKNLRPVVLVSYAGYSDRRIESAGSLSRIEMMRKVHQRGVPVLQYLRPLVKEWLEPEQLEKNRDTVMNNIDGIVMSGIRLTPEIIRKISGLGLPIPKVNNYENKSFPKELQERVLEVYQEVCPVYRYTSCGVSATLGIPDYNSHLKFIKETQCKEYSICPLPCKDQQSKICISQPNVQESDVKILLSKIGHHEAEILIRPSGVIIINKDLSKPELSFLRHNTGCHVEYVHTTGHHIDEIVGMDIKSKK